jgi:hypothetical protein
MEARQKVDGRNLTSRNTQKPYISTTSQAGGLFVAWSQGSCGLAHVFFFFLPNSLSAVTKFEQGNLLMGAYAKELAMGGRLHACRFVRQCFGFSLSLDDMLTH